MDGSPKGLVFEMGVEVVDRGGLVAGQLASDFGIGTGVGQVGHEGVAQGMERTFGEFASGRIGDLATIHSGVVPRRVVEQSSSFVWTREPRLRPTPRIPIP